MVSGASPAERGIWTSVSFLGVGAGAWLIASAAALNPIAAAFIAAGAGSVSGKIVHANLKPEEQRTPQDQRVSDVAFSWGDVLDDPSVELGDLAGKYTREQWREAAELDREANEIALQYAAYLKESDGSMLFADWRSVERPNAGALGAYQARVAVLAGELEVEIDTTNPEFPPGLVDIMKVNDKEAREGFRVRFSQLLQGIRGELEMSPEAMMRELALFKDFVDHRRAQNFSYYGQGGDMGEYFKAWNEYIGAPEGVQVVHSQEGIGEGQVMVAAGVHVNGGHYKTLLWDPVKKGIDLDNVKWGRGNVNLTGENGTKPYILTVSEERLAELEDQTRNWTAPKWAANNCYLATAAILHAVADFYST